MQASGGDPGGGWELDLLAVSNGHGEDAIACHLLEALTARHPSRRVGALPLVGPGRAYDRRGIPVLFRSWPMPSEGFGWQNARLFLKDLAAGFITLTAQQLDALRSLRSRTRALLLVGDIYPILLTAAYRVPRVFVATARSDHIAPHLAVEVRLMAAGCRLVFARDELTARSLERRGAPAVFAGNVMMDLVQPRGLSLGLDPERPVLALLPGSRRDAADNLAALAGVVRRVRRVRPEVQAVAALAGELPPLFPGGSCLRLEPSGGLGTHGVDAVVTDGQDLTVPLTLEGFSDLLSRATVVLGLAGTANEQAAGLGLPVVAFPRPAGAQYTRRFARRQKRLLGEALVLADGPEEAALQVLRLLEDPGERRRRGEAGRARMGPPGATARMVGWVERALGWCATCPPLQL